MNRADRRARERSIKLAARGLVTEIVRSLAAERGQASIMAGTFEGDKHISVTVCVDPQVTELLSFALDKVFYGDEDDDDSPDEEEGEE